MNISDLLKVRHLTAVFTAAIMMLPSSSYALCYGDRHPSVKDETTSSRFVFIGLLKKSQNVSSPDDPEGIDATLYDVVVKQVFSGRPPAIVTIRSENTSSRFIISPNKEYLLFANGEVDAAFVDACGNSGPVSERKSIIDQLSRSSEK